MAAENRLLCFFITLLPYYLTSDFTSLQLSNLELSYKYKIILILKLRELAYKLA
jgi:hypothetical protein